VDTGVSFTLAIARDVPAVVRRTTGQAVVSDFLAIIGLGAGIPGNIILYLNGLIAALSQTHAGLDHLWSTL
jgi:hypothetical protein